MTAARQERKSRRRPAIHLANRSAILAGIVAAIAALAGTGHAAAQASAVISERVVVNLHTGLAIDGFDPVAYFVDGKPRTGRAELEMQYAGASWRFRNQGNRAAFAAAPKVYMPRFGGYDPIAVARGAATAGHPRLWLIAEQRLYLFYSAEARATFAANPESAIEAAERHWPEVLRTLAP
jgi:YHS domain-containing protein